MSKYQALVSLQLYIRDKRAFKRSQRLRRALRAALLRKKSDVEFGAAFGTHSRIIKLLSSTTDDVGIAHKGRVKFNLPAKFSIIDNPEPTLAAIASLAREARDARKLNGVYIDFARLTLYDLGANALLDVLVDEVSIQARRSGRTFRWRGNFPTNPAHDRFVRAMGVIKSLKIQSAYPSKEDSDRLELFNNRSRHYIRMLHPKRADRKSIVTTQFADHINRCLQTTIGRQLTGIARSRMCAYVGEILDNAEQHSGMFDWTIQGYLDTMLEKPMCEIVIFNFGNSIAETFEKLAPDSFTRDQVQKYIDIHSSGGFFTTGWRKEDLYTLISLQGSVSSKNVIEGNTRGNGTVDLIEFFQRVHDECSNGDATDARMAIVSGSTYILFDGKYKMQSNAAGIKIIAFNMENDLTKRPDSQYIRKLDGVDFKGTLISLKFPLSTAKSTVTTTVNKS